MEDEADNICPICLNTPSIPVILKILDCRCRLRQRYCLTCVRDSLNLNGTTDYTLTSCPTCQSPFNSNEHVLRKYRVKCSDIYRVDEKFITILDKKWGDIKCPRECGWTGKRLNARDHLKVCDKACRFKCWSCGVIFTKQDLLDHINIKFPYHSADYPKCSTCYKAFLDNDSVYEHELTCRNKYKCINCTSVFTEKHHLFDHLNDQANIQCSYAYHFCEWCEITFVTNDDLIKHITCYPKLKQCSVCKIEFTPDVFSEHFEQCATNEITHLNSLIEKKKCLICKQEFPFTKFLNHYEACATIEIIKLKNQLCS